MAVPSTPTVTVTGHGDGTLTLEWGVDATAEYFHVYLDSSVTPLAMHARGTGTEITNLTNGQEYSIEVSGHNADGEGDKSTPVTGTPMTVPGAPTSLAAVFGNVSTVLTWVAPLNNGGSAITGYKIYYGTTANPTTNETAVGDVLTSTITPLVNGTKYYFRIKATNAEGDSAYSNEVDATPATVPGAPTGLTLVPGNTKITLSWTAPASNGGDAIDYYQVIKNGTPLALHALTTGTIATGLTNDVPYTFTIKAHNKAGLSVASSGATDIPVSGLPLSFVEPVNAMAYNLDTVNGFVFNITTGTYVNGGVTLDIPRGFTPISAIAVMSGTPIAQAAFVTVEITDGVATLKMYDSSYAEATSNKVLVNAIVFAKID